MAPELRPATDGDPQKLLDRWTRLHPPVFGGERHEDVQDFIAGSPPMTWSQFTQLFLDMYIPPSKREELRYLFEQGHMSVIDYEVRFSKLSRHALMILPTDAERIRRFVAGLHSGIRANMAREVEMGTSYQLVVETARRIEGYRQRWKEKMQQDKRVHFSGEFRGQFGRGQPSKPPYSSPRPPRGHQGSSSSYFSSMPESSYRPPAIQDSSSGSTGHQGQTSGQQITAPRGYFECRDLGHMKRFCPRLRGKSFGHRCEHRSASAAMEGLCSGHRGGRSSADADAHLREVDRKSGFGKASRASQVQRSLADAVPQASGLLRVREGPSAFVMYNNPNGFRVREGCPPRPPRLRASARVRVEE
nr:uncharacterized protein LOC117280082 [Nicotiana tomentosiformis]